MVKRENVHGPLDWGSSTWVKRFKIDFAGSDSGVNEPLELEKDAEPFDRGLSAGWTTETDSPWGDERPQHVALQSTDFTR